MTFHVKCFRMFVVSGWYRLSGCALCCRVQCVLLLCLTLLHRLTLLAHVDRDNSGEQKGKAKEDQEGKDDGGQVEAALLLISIAGLLAVSCRGSTIAGGRGTVAGSGGAIAGSRSAVRLGRSAIGSGGGAVSVRRSSGVSATATVGVSASVGVISVALDNVSRGSGAGHSQPNGEFAVHSVCVRCVLEVGCNVLLVVVRVAAAKKWKKKGQNRAGKLTHRRHWRHASCERRSEKRRWGTAGTGPAAPAGESGLRSSPGRRHPGIQWERRTMAQESRKTAQGRRNSAQVHHRIGRALEHCKMGQELGLGLSKRGQGQSMRVLALGRCKMRTEPEGRHSYCLRKRLHLILRHD